MFLRDTKHACHGEPPKRSCSGFGHQTAGTTDQRIEKEMKAVKQPKDPDREKTLIPREVPQDLELETRILMSGTVYSSRIIDRDL